MSHFVAAGLSLALVVSAAAPAAAASSDAFEFFNEEAKVVTASRHAQAISDSPVAIDVITAEEIAASGATSLWDLLRFRPGMDVALGRSIDGNRAIVSVRGFPLEFASNVLVLIDGRTAYSEVGGGVYWEQLPVQLQDVERIEIVRGPNAALYGTGAGLGVINIITRKPTGDTLARLAVRAGNREMTETSEAAESRVRRFSFRASHTYKRDEGLERLDGGESTDFILEQKGNLRGILAVSSDTDIDVSAGAVWEGAGIESADDRTGRFRNDFQMARLDHRLPEGSVQLSAFRNDEDIRVGPVYNGDYDVVETDQYGVDGLHEFGWFNDRLHTTYGGSYRAIRAESDRQFIGHPVQHAAVARGFANQSLRVTRRWTLTGALSLENTYGAGTRPAYHVASLFRPVEDQCLRLSHSMSYTSPSLFHIRGNDQVDPVVHVVGNEDLLPQRLTSYEVGHTGRYLDGRLHSELSLFYTSIRDIEGAIITAFSLTPVPDTEVTFLNTNYAIARGVESGLSYHWSTAGSAYVNHTWERITDRLGDTDLVTRNTPSHKVNVGANAPLGHGFTANVNAGYKNAYLMRSLSRAVTVAAPAHIRVDAKLGYRPAPYPALELFVAGQNLERSRHLEAADGLAATRRWQVGMSCEFGARK